MDELTLWETTQRLLIAFGLGGAIGLEREILRKPAGLRTHMLVAASCALLVLLSAAAFLSIDPISPNQNIQTDPIRIIQAIAIGIGFLGSGTIVKDEKNGTVQNLTTAASIFYTAAVGIAVGLGYAKLAAISAVLALVVNYGVGYLEYWHSKRS